jgi:hypothetical protein
VWQHQQCQKLIGFLFILGSVNLSVEKGSTQSIIGIALNKQVGLVQNQVFDAAHIFFLDTTQNIG